MTQTGRPDASLRVSASLGGTLFGMDGNMTFDFQPAAPEESPFAVLKNLKTPKP